MMQLESKPDFRTQPAQIANLVLIASLLLTAVATYSAAKLFLTRDRLHFDKGVAHTKQALEQRIKTYMDMLYLGGALYASTGHFTRSAFHDYVTALRLDARYPGIQGIGFSLRVAPDEIEELSRRMREEGLLDFRIWPEDGLERHAIIYLEPLDSRNQRAIGYNMFSDPVRRAAMETARDSGAAAASGKVTLKQESGEETQPGFLIYYPVFQGGIIPDSLEGRRRDLAGFVYSPFRSGDLFRGVLGDEEKLTVDFRVIDGTNRVSESVLYQSPGMSRGTKPRFKDQSEIQIAGRTWTMEFASGTLLESTSGIVVVPFLALGGLAVSLALFRLSARQGEAYMGQKRRSEQMELRNEINAALSGSCADPLSRCAEIIARELPAAVARFWILDPAQGELELRGSSGIPNHPVPLNSRVRLGDSEIGRIAEKGRPFIRHTPESGAAGPENTWVQQERIASCAGFPLKSGRKLMGVLEVFTRQRLTEEESDFLAHLADVMAHGMHRRQIEQALRESEERLRIAVESTELGTWDFHPLSRELRCSARAKVMFGLEENDRATVDDWLARVLPEDRQALASSVATALDPARDGNFEVDFRTVGLNGTIHWLSAKGRAVFEEAAGGPTVARFSGTVLDISRRKQAEERSRFLADAGVILSESMEYEKMLAGLARLAVPRLADSCEVDLVRADGAIDGLELVHVDISKTELLREIRRRYPLDPNAEQGVPAVIRTGKAQYLAEITDAALEAEARDAEHLKLLQSLGMRSVIVVPIKARERVFGALSFVFSQSGRFYTPEDLAVVEDLALRAGLAMDNGLLYREAQVELAERKRAEEEIQRLNQDLEQRVRRRTAALQDTNEQLEAFTYTVAHDLRAPLRAMQGFSQALLEDCATSLDNNGQDYTRRVIAAAQRMDALIQDLLSYSRLSRTPISTEIVALETILERVLSTFAQEIKKREATIEVKSPLPSVLAHATTLEFVLSNLISNALKFTASDVRPHVRIWAEARGVSVRCCVADNGIGIAPEYHDRIFRVFERLHGTESFSGTGIGLAIVKKGIQRMGGRTGLESQLNDGSTFWIELPGTSLLEV